jgi:peptide/nickel transport system substrate-binding protein
VVAEQLKSVGINAKLLVLDWPASFQMFDKTSTGWHYFFDAFGNNPVIGPISSVRKFASPINAYKPRNDSEVDKVFNAAFDEMINGATPEIRKAAFARAQARLFEQVYVIPFGSLTKLQAVRSNVQNFRPYRIPRMANVYFSN